MGDDMRLKDKLWTDGLPTYLKTILIENNNQPNQYYPITLDSNQNLRKTIVNRPDRIRCIYGLGNRSFETLRIWSGLGPTSPDAGAINRAITFLERHNYIVTQTAT